MSFRFAPSVYLSKPLAFVLFIPYSPVWATLMIFSVLEWFARRCFVGEHRLFNQLYFVVAERNLWSTIDKDFSVPVLRTFSKTGERVRGLFFPSLVIRRSEQHKQYVQRAEEETKEIEAEIGICKRLLSVVREERRRKGSALAQGNTTPLDSDYMIKSILDTQRLEGHIQALEKERDKLKYNANSQAAADYTGYRGLVDWAKTTLEIHEHLITSLIQISFIGAGLTYGAIFSAGRGNIGLMCYAFTLFNFGFIVPSASLALLKWACHRPETSPFAAPRFWKVALSLAIYTSITATACAICLLNVTIFQLHFPLDKDGLPMNAPLQLNVTPSPAAYLAFIPTGVVVIVTFMILTCVFIVNGWAGLFSGRMKGEI